MVEDGEVGFLACIVKVSIGFETLNGLLETCLPIEPITPSTK